MSQDSPAIEPPPESTPNAPTRKILDWSRNHAPEATMIAIGAFALISVAIYALSTGRTVAQVAQMTGLVILIGGVGTIAGRWVKTAAPKNFAEVMTWAVGALFVLLLAAMVFALAFPSSSRLGTYIWSLIMSPADLFNSTKKPLALRSLEPSALEQFRDIPQRGLDRLDALTARGKVSLTGAVLANGPVRIHAHTLVLSSAQIVTNGHDITIEVLDLDLGSGSAVKAFNSTDAIANSAGKSAGNVTLIVHRSVVGQVGIDLKGTSGAPGNAGPNGPPGPGGRPGDNAASGLFDCSRGAGAGGPGGAGGQGGNGSPGWPGGQGGTLTIRAPKDIDLRQRFRPVDFSGGSGGTGGAQGKGGPGGPGGPGGSPRGNCHGGGPNGAPGASGPDGASGAPGSNGKDGVWRTEALDS